MYENKARVTHQGTVPFLCPFGILAHKTPRVGCTRAEVEMLESCFQFRHERLVLWPSYCGYILMQLKLSSLGSQTKITWY